MRDELWLLLVCAGVAVAWYTGSRLFRRMAENATDPTIEALIRQNAAETSSRRRWTDFDPDIRERAKSKRAQESAVRSRANQLASTDVSRRPMMLQYPERKARG